MNSTESREVLQDIYSYSYYLYFKEISACLMGESLKGPIAWKTLSPVVCTYWFLSEPTNSQNEESKQVSTAHPVVTQVQLPEWFA